MDLAILEDILMYLFVCNANHIIIHKHKSWIFLSADVLNHRLFISVPINTYFCTFCLSYTHAVALFYSKQNKKTQSDPVSCCRCMASGEPGSLWLPAAEEHAGKDPHAGSEGRDAGDALWKLQSPVHPEHDAHGGAGEEAQVGEVGSKFLIY